MYLEYWQMKALPFENVPNPAFFYASSIHEEGLSRLVYAVRQGKGAAMVVGDIGCGKTMLAQALPSQLPPQQYRIVQMRNPALDPLDFLQMVLILFQVPVEDSLSKAKMLHALESNLRMEQDKGRHSVLVVDEAQTIKNPDTLDELRMLLNLQTPSHFLVNLVLLGQKELEGLVSLCPPLLQRLSIRFRLGPLSAMDTANYIQHRIMVAGAKTVPFTPEAIKKIYEYTHGIPRDINNLSDRTLLAAYIRKQQLADGSIVEEAWHDLQ